MSNATHLQRPSLRQTKPNRAPGSLYRSADSDRTGLGGVPLTSAEDAMVAAVRMAYDIADSQIARSKRLADRLKGAADRATGNAPDDGQKSAEDAVDAASRMVNNAMLSGMTWVEALMAAEDGLAPRLVAAQLKAAKSVIFNTREDRDAEAGPSPRTAAAEPARRPPLPHVRIVLTGPEKDRRAVSLRRWDVERAVDAKVSFHMAQQTAPTKRPSGSLEWQQGTNRPTLRMSVPAAAPAGRWRAAICDSDGEQFGIVEIEI